MLMECWKILSLGGPTENHRRHFYEGRGEWVLGKISYLCLSVCVQSFIREGPCGLSIHNVIKAERSNVSKCSVSLQVFEN